MNIVDPILFQCRTNAEQPAICVPGTRLDLITYAQLEYMINNLTRSFLSLGFQPEQVVGIFVQDEIFHFAVTLALTRIGVVTVSCGTPSLPPELDADAIIIDGLELVTGAKRVVRANLTGAKQIMHADPEWVKGNPNPVVDPRLVKASGDEICRIFLTSGSTGSPKGVACSHNTLLRKDSQLNYAYGGRWPQSSRLYCDMGLRSGPAFKFLLYMLMRGGMIMLRGQDPMITEQSLELFKIQNMATPPSGLAEHLKFYENTRFGCHLDHIHVLGGALPKALTERTWSRMCLNLITVYGATEVGTIAAADARDTLGIPGAAGYVTPGSSVEIVDDAGKALGANQEGIVRLRTPHMASGYVGQPDESARVFRGGWFYPGDHGYLTQDNLLVVTGRLETRLNVGGDIINPEWIEEVLTTFPGVDDAAALTLPNAVGLEEMYALIRASDTVDDKALRVYCQSRMTPCFVPVRFIFVEQIPRGEAGKIQRGPLARLAQSNLT